MINLKFKEKTINFNTNKFASSKTGQYFHRVLSLLNFHRVNVSKLEHFFQILGQFFFQVIFVQQNEEFRSLMRVNKLPSSVEIGSLVCFCSDVLPRANMSC
jgi:hypothetical protein